MSTVPADTAMRCQQKPKESSGSLLYELHFSCKGAVFKEVKTRLLAGGTRAELSQLASSFVPAPPDVAVLARVLTPDRLSERQPKYLTRKRHLLSRVSVSGPGSRS
jgi:hypothetical protein